MVTIYKLYYRVPIERVLVVKKLSTNRERLQEESGAPKPGSSALTCLVVVNCKNTKSLCLNTEYNINTQCGWGLLSTDYCTLFVNKVLYMYTEPRLRVCHMCPAYVR